MTFLRTAAASVLATALCGCLSSRVERVVGVDGSGDHRVFRLGAVTRLMMEPVLWRLEDTEKINFDRPVGLYFKDPLPPEFEKVTLRMLHDGKTGLPRDLRYSSARYRYLESSFSRHSREPSAISV